jgi:hypothetical protein
MGLKSRKPTRKPADKPLAELVFCDGVWRDPGLVYLIAHDPREDIYESATTYLVRWDRSRAGEIKRVTSRGWIAHACCQVEEPEWSWVLIGYGGTCGINRAGRITFGNVFRDCVPKPDQPRYSELSSVSAVAGEAYAVGLSGTACRLAGGVQWTRIEDGLDPSADLAAIDGFSAEELYAVGERGAVWRFDGARWQRVESPPAAANLAVVRCAPDGTVYAGGKKGALVAGRGATWRSLAGPAMTDDIWGLAWFDGALHVATMSRLYRLAGQELEPVDFGADAPATCYRLATAPGRLLSVGARDVMAFDGQRWSRIF